jgi:PIN domain nuclease of toxin-antitoxin system
VILLDSHVVAWLLIAPERLSGRARDAILQARIAGEKIGCSPVSFYELATAARRGRLELNCTTEEFIAAIRARIESIPLTAEIAVCAAEFPEPFHGDPMDRIIAATAVANNCTLITRDARIRGAKACKALW